MVFIRLEVFSRRRLPFEPQDRILEVAPPELDICHLIWIIRLIKIKLLSRIIRKGDISITLSFWTNPVRLNLHSSQRLGGTPFHLQDSVLNKTHQFLLLLGGHLLAVQVGRQPHQLLRLTALHTYVHLLL